MRVDWPWRSPPNPSIEEGGLEPAQARRIAVYRIPPRRARRAEELRAIADPVRPLALRGAPAPEAAMTVLTMSEIDGYTIHRIDRKGTEAVITLRRLK